MSSADKNKALVRRFLEARAAADLGVMDEVLAPDCIDRSVLPGQGPSREDYMQKKPRITLASPTCAYTSRIK